MLTQLSPQDASFIYLETPDQPMHVGSIAIYNPETSPDGEFTEERLISLIEERLHLWPTSRKRIVNVPFNLDHPYWIEDENFDIEYHVRQSALPRPGDWKTLNKVCARIFSRPLDLSRPLWEFYLIEGLDNLDGMPANCYAILSKTHHAAIDGASGIHLLELLHDLSPEATKIEPPKQPWRPDPVPSDMELMTRTWGNNMLQPFKMAEVLSQSIPALQRGMQEMASLKPDQYGPVPKTRFNSHISAHRVIGSASFDFELVRTMKKSVPGATVNDVVLSLCGGAIRRYLDSKRELPDDSLVCMAPVNVRSEEDKGNFGNQVSAMFVPIGTDISDPLERLHKVFTSTHKTKAMTKAVGARTLTDYNQFIPAFTAAQAGRLSTQFANVPQPAFNCSITNVPGPQIPLYSLGAKMETMIGLGPITDGMGLIMPISSYCGQLVIGFTSCREMIPDADFFTTCITDSFDELRLATKG
jgi:diacylglycerol O-acyltransferase / wax synthase